MADRRLQVFHTVARLLSFTKAAETLHMTQPAVTFQVRQLEEYFDTRLFDRTHNKISLTAAGTVVYRYADQIAGLYGEMESAVFEITGAMGGSLIIGASTTISEYMLPALLCDFKRKYPQVSIHLRVANTDGVVRMVEGNDIDLGIVEAPVANRNLVVETCRVDELVAIAPPDHDLAQRRGVDLRTCLNYPFVCREEGSGTREVIEECLAAAGIDRAAMNICMELGSPESVKGAVEGGMGVSIISKLTIGKELALKRLAAISLTPKLERSFFFVRQRQKFRRRIMDELLTFARDYYGPATRAASAPKAE